MPSAKKKRRPARSEDPFKEIIDQFVDGVMENPDVQDVLDTFHEFRELFRQTGNAVDPKETHEANDDAPPPKKSAPKRRKAPPPPRQPNVVELELKARYTLHFGPQESLTKEAIKNRRRKLAALCHPDQGGTTEAMQAINSAADFLLEKL